MDTSKKPNPNSKRSKRRKKRGFTVSRPNRRAMERLNSAVKGYISETDAGHQRKKPGAINHW